ncbi:MAG: hypothetical protein IJ219_04955 [Bacteroidaceae bacterium]|nr:hypothetical protein [Bacteroidaceae bacterium]
MKHQSLILLLATTCLLTGVQTAMAQKVVLHMRGDKAFECNISQLDSITFVEESELCSQMESDAECSLFYEAMSATGLCELLNQNSKDESWDYSRYLSYEKEYSLPSFSQHCHIPRTRETGFTVFACTNEALKSKYGIHDLQGFYDFALSVYGGTANEALRKLLSYCIIDRKSTLERLTTLCSIDTLVSQPTEWYSTLLPHSLLKITRDKNKTFMNLSGNTQGIRISQPQCDNICGNGSYFLTDGLPLYDEGCRSAFASERMRMDFYTLIPEMENVMMRSSASYYLPNDYLPCLSASADTYIIYEDMHETSPFHEGDCLWLCGRYDVTFKIPAVPKQGTYEIRIGYTAMPNNGIAQIYLGTDTQNMYPVGIPMSFNRDANANGLPWIPLSSADEEESLNSRKAIRNCGFMHGPASAYYISEPNTRKKFCDNPSTLRSIVARQSFEKDSQYYLRFKSIVDGDRPICLDYIELVHKDVYDNPETPEDIY